MKEVSTQWNSKFHMLERLHSESEVVGAALASLQTDVLPLTSGEFLIVKKVCAAPSKIWAATHVVHIRNCL